MKPGRPDSGGYPSPPQLLLIILASICLIELSSMLYIHMHAPASIGLKSSVIDAIVETVLLFPLLYVFLYRPMSTHIGQRRNAEENLRRSRDDLEERVEQRTADLRNSEKKLRLLSTHILTAQEEERKRLAMELHDEVSQDLASLKLQLRAVLRAAEDDPQDLRRECEESLEVTRQIMDKVQRISRDLAPVMLVELGLAQALNRLLEEAGKKYSFRVTGDFTESGSHFSSGVERNVYRIFQEIFTNIGKHARAREVTVSAREEGGRYLFAVEDDGDGFDSDEAARRQMTENGLGLLFLEERARMAGGSITVSSTPGKGTGVYLSLPIEEGRSG